LFYFLVISDEYIFTVLRPLAGSRIADMHDPLYRKEILRLAADATGAGRLAQPHGSATLHNPTCGDRITVDVAVEKGRVSHLAHHTHACILTQASAAILGSHATGLDKLQITSLLDGVRAMLKGAPPPGAPFAGFAVFDGLTDYPARHKCVLLPLEAAQEALGLLDMAEPGA
jgi:NifU-like protein involved in Fe-S cluster formation